MPTSARTRAVLAAVALLWLATACGAERDTAPDPAAEAGPEVELRAATPPQAEGPYYPTRIPDDSDADLRVVSGRANAARGTPLELAGALYDRRGAPLGGATIEIWQADHAGVYLHPNAPGGDTRDTGFQGYGRAVTDRDGRWRFSTIDPGHYEVRPRHIHLRVNRDGATLLTTQIYFNDDLLLSEDHIAAGAGGELNLLVARVTPGMAADGTRTLSATHDLVVER